MASSALDFDCFEGSSEGSGSISGPYDEPSDDQPGTLGTSLTAASAGRSAAGREARQHSRYHIVFADQQPGSAWEIMPSGEIACHASQMLFPTAVQALKYMRSAAYTAETGKEGGEDDPETLAQLERQAATERDELHRQRKEAVKKESQAKQALRLQLAVQSKLNRQLAHELRGSQAQLAKQQAQHQHQMEHLRTMYERRISKLEKRLKRRQGSGDGSDSEMPERQVTQEGSIDAMDELPSCDRTYEAALQLASRMRELLLCDGPDSLQSASLDAPVSPSRPVLQSKAVGPAGAMCNQTIPTLPRWTSFW